MNYFTDPVFRAPMIGSMLICFATALMGVFTYMRKRSLLGEALSHATYPGVMVGAVVASGIAGLFDRGQELLTVILPVIGAFFTAILGLRSIEWLTRKGRVKSDTALCFVLSLFFGVGILIASRMQITHSILYQRAQSYLYGQAATLTDLHIWIYAGLSCIILGFVGLFYYPIQITLFDEGYGKVLGVKTKWIEKIAFVLLVLSIVIGIRSVGIVLISGMLIAPAVAARQFTHKLSRMFLLAGIFGLISAFLGNLLSLQFSEIVEGHFFPTGPSIVLVAISWAVFSLLFAPKRGLLFRKARILRFKRKCIAENLLKSLWKDPNHCLGFSEIYHQHSLSKLSLSFLLFRMHQHGWIAKANGSWLLTKDGKKKAAQIVRLHRLWELYLVENLGLKANVVHQSAEQMEHILTPEMERKLTQLLENPTKDPHKQPIPEKGGIV